MSRRYGATPWEDTLRAEEADEEEPHNEVDEDVAFGDDDPSVLEESENEDFEEEIGHRQGQHQCPQPPRHQSGKKQLLRPLLCAI